MPREIVVRVDGWPPAKDGSKSIFNPEHPRHPLVRALLAAAGDAIAASGWRCLGSGVPIGLELVVSRRAALNGRADPANYIGGVCDVLQADRQGVAPSWLGAHAASALYENDSQVREIHYREESLVPAGYRVRVWKL
ncbi:MAG: hypothetical protein F4Z29_09780 [Gemmatimonadetes bacterium]|nr:hypothetical protein [Gemmatimonadota bacterium]